MSCTTAVYKCIHFPGRLRIVVWGFWDNLNKVKKMNTLGWTADISQSSLGLIATPCHIHDWWSIHPCYASSKHTWVRSTRSEAASDELLPGQGSGRGGAEPVLPPLQLLPQHPPATGPDHTPAEAHTAIGWAEREDCDKHNHDVTVTWPPTLYLQGYNQWLQE